MSSTAAKPAGNCSRCGGQIYELLVHHCTTARIVIHDLNGTNPPTFPQLWPPTTNANP